MKSHCFSLALLACTLFTLSEAWQQQPRRSHRGARKLKVVPPVTFLQVSPNPLERKFNNGNVVPVAVAAKSHQRRGVRTSLSSSTAFPQDTTNALARNSLNDETDIDTVAKSGLSMWIDDFLSTYWGPRGLLLVLAAVYATNFPLGALMNDHLPASAATASRMFVASLALAPFIPRLDPQLRIPAILCGCFTAMGYVTQSLALQDVDPARVSFLGSCTVLWCPMLEGMIEKKPMSLKDAPQTWLAALLCLAGIGVLELSGGGEESLSLAVTSGDVWALLQAVGFGTGVFWTSHMVRNESSQALPVTATLVATTAFWSMLWCLMDGWMMTGDGAFQLTLPGMAMDPSMHSVFLAVLWTGLISTSLNFFVELTALGKVPPSEASVLLASEPLWAALLAASFYGSNLSLADGVGGILIVSACLVNALVQPEMLWPADKDHA